MSCADLRARDGRGSWGGRGSDAVCGESDILNNGETQCFGGNNGHALNNGDGEALSWSDAETICLTAGARLCTVEEIEGDEAASTGCGHDSELAS